LLPLFVCGLFLGIGFEIKYVVLFDWLALSVMLAFVFFTQRSLNIKPVQILSAFLSLLIGFLLPFAIVSIYFWAHGNFAGYIEANYAANRLRTVQLEFSLLSAIKAFYWQFLIERFFWISIPSAIIYLIFARPIPSRERFIVLGFVVSFVCVLLGIAGVFRVSFNNHYFLQLSPSYCFATAFILIRVIFSDISIQHSEIWRRSILLVVLPLLIATTNLFTALKSGIEHAYYRHVRGIARWNDIPGTIADYLKPRLHPKDYIFVVNDFPIIYYLTNARIPTRYAFPPFLIIQKDLPNITGIVPVKELQLILQMKPAYIVMRNSVATDEKYLGSNRSFFETLRRSLAKDYSLDSRMRGYSIYGLKNSP
jgi:hypothetical protein